MLFEEKMCTRVPICFLELLRDLDKGSMQMHGVLKHWPIFIVNSGLPTELKSNRCQVILRCSIIDL